MSARTDLTQMGGVSLVRPPDPPNALQTLITVIDGTVVLDFGRALWWVGFDSAQAEKLGTELIAAARQARALHIVGG
jgi:hypothetical protein